MEYLSVVAAALIASVLTAVIGMLLLRSRQKGEAGRRMIEQVLPDGVEQSLSALPFPAFVVEASNEVLLTTPSLEALGVVEGHRVVVDEIVDGIDQVRETGEHLEQQLVLHRGRGENSDSHITTHISVLGNRYILVVVEDRTQAMLVETMRRDFTANVSHELKTPISAAMLLSEAVGGAADDSEMVERFNDKLRLELERLASMVADIISLSRIESAAEETAHFDEVDLAQIIRRAQATTKVAADIKHITVTMRTEGNVRLEADPDTLATAIGNLIANALEYAPEGGLVGVLAKEEGEQVHVTVTDNGEGIPAKLQSRVFERFYRVDPSRVRTSGTGGTGLGLSIVKHIVRRHGGTVSLWSKPGVGSSFTLALPRTQRAPHAVIGTESDHPTESPVVLKEGTTL
ncbi:sensor histidine kinase [Pseudoclavibacter soli]|uniref:sensor histidine kinase n=1 Tax=Pseudoclavibacter soli TaxID=452623 RepID=UPI000408845D|nr:ATP-binding protein [Pseudoclavibacter soli]